MRKLFAICSLLLGISALGQTTAVTATLQDSNGQLWANGSYTITFVPTPGIPGPFYWQGNVFAPQVYRGSMNGSGVLSVTLPDNFTITPSGSQWSFVLCSNTSAPCSTIVVPVTGTTEDFSSTFSSRITPPMLFSAPMPRAYSSAEIYTPPPNQGGQYFNVGNSIPYFWNGTTWINLGGTVTSIGLTLPSLFTCTGSPVTTEGTIVCDLANQNANTVFAGPSSGSPAAPTFRALTTADISSLLPTLYYQTFQSNGTAQTQEPAANFSSNFTLGTASGATTIDLVNTGTAGTVTCPASVTTDSKGRVTAASSGTCPGTSTQTNVTASRAWATSYQNTTGATLIVSGYTTTPNGSSVGTITCLTGASSPTLEVWGNEYTATVASAPVAFFCIVPNTYYYEMTVSGDIASSPSNWIETTVH